MENIPIRNFGDNIFAPLTDVKKTHIKPSHMSINTRLRNSALDVCKHQINPNYIKDIFKPFTNGFNGGFMYTSEDSDDILGFVVWDIKSEYIKFMSNIEHPDDNIQYNTMYIKLICSKDGGKHIGKHMLHDCELYCIENNIQTITLIAATEALVSYYERVGYSLHKEKYEHPNTGKVNSILHMKKKISIIPKHKANNFRTKYTRKQKRAHSV